MASGGDALALGKNIKERAALVMADGQVGHRRRRALLDVSATPAPSPPEAMATARPIAGSPL